jgi:hypothetical protein
VGATPHLESDDSGGMKQKFNLPVGYALGGFNLLAYLTKAHDTIPHKLRNLRQKPRNLAGSEQPTSVRLRDECREPGGGELWRPSHCLASFVVDRLDGHSDSRLVCCGGAVVIV